MVDTRTEKVRISPARNEQLKEHAKILGISAADLTDRALEAVFAMFDGDTRVPLLVAEYQLKKAYAKGSGDQLTSPAEKAKRKG